MKTSKVCKKCGIEKPITEFSWSIKSKNQRQIICKPCAAKQSREYRQNDPLKEMVKRKKFYEKHREKLLARKVEYYKENRDEIVRKKHVRYERDKDKINKKRRESRDKTKDRYLRDSYGITLADFNNMVINQHGKCLICSRDATLKVDHCHKTGKIRGLLCSACNSFLGRIDDSIDALKRAIEYLNK